MAGPAHTLATTDGDSDVSVTAAAAVVADLSLVDAAMQPDNLPTRAELVDAALAYSLTRSSADEEELDVFVEPMAIEVAPTTRDSPVSPPSTGETMTADEPTAAVLDAEQFNESWLTEEMVEGMMRSIISGD